MLWCGAWQAWETHLKWRENGDYARNSLPMNRVARDSAMIAGFATALLAGITIWNLTRRPGGPKQSP
jgi:hypothetical protein